MKNITCIAKVIYRIYTKKYNLAETYQYDLINKIWIYNIYGFWRKSIHNE